MTSGISEDSAGHHTHSAVHATSVHPEAVWRADRRRREEQVRHLPVLFQSVEAKAHEEHGCNGIDVPSAQQVTHFGPPELQIQNITLLLKGRNHRIALNIYLWIVWQRIFFVAMMHSKSGSEGWALYQVAIEAHSNIH